MEISSNTEKMVHEICSLDEMSFDAVMTSVYIKNPHPKIMNAIIEKWKYTLFNRNENDEYNELLTTMQPVAVESECVPSSSSYPATISHDEPRKHLKHKIVHLDLKGMPPLSGYYNAFFPFLRKLGVTGILLEYEDMFPYNGKLAGISNKVAYSESEIRFIIETAKMNNIQVIPLVQTFGHLEFVLKLENFMSLRENPNYAQVICPSKNSSMELIQEIIDQVMQLHPGVEYLHIGSDEVYHIGQCSDCVCRMNRENINKSQLFLTHVKNVAQYVKQRYNVRPMMWDDEFRKLDEEAIIAFEIGGLVDIVVWNYHEEVEKHLPLALWSKYGRIFSSVWTGSAFKGADKPDSMIVNESRYLANHYSWVNVMKDVSQHLKFQGIILTGWQRYDHFAILCEILPVAIPSLTCCMTYLNTLENVNVETIFARVSASLASDDFPGSNVYRTVKQLYNCQLGLQNIQKNPVFLGYAHSYNLRTQFSSPAYIESLLTNIRALALELEVLESVIAESLREVFGDWSVSEFMQMNFYPLYEEVKILRDKMKRILDRKWFPLRPLTNF